jgi:NADPH-dependent 2,4-dienoyl-CoA reductase/sulfur reductase-like enzyme
VPDRVVIVGASLAGLRAAEGLRQHGHVGSITVIGEEVHRPYDRPPLSKQVLTGKVGPESVALHVADDLDIEWLLGAAATGLDLNRKVVSFGAGETVPFDGLVIATGARPRILPTVAPRPGVHYLRTLDDSAALRDDLARSERTVVIGAGFIGLEVAASAHQLGVHVSVLEALPVPLERAIGAQMGRALADWHVAKGIDLRLGVGVGGVEGTDRPEVVRLADGTDIPADTVVVGVGVAPATDWLTGSGVDVADGVLCDETLRVLEGGYPRPDVVAAGDVARWAHPGYGESVRIEHWTNASEQGDLAAQTLVRGDGAPPYSPTPYFWSDQHGVKVQFVGRARPDDLVQIIEGSVEEERFVAAYGRGGRLVAALGMRRPARVMAMQEMITRQEAFPAST